MLWLAVALLTAALAPAADGACEGPEYHRLDFWIGEWTVVDAAGHVVGTNRWKQVWVTDAATVLGGVKEKRELPIADGGMRFQGELVDRDRIILDRTTLTPLGGGRVRQLIETSIDGGTTWKAQFDAVYERTTRSPARR